MVQEEEEEVVEFEVRRMEKPDYLLLLSLPYLEVEL